MQVFNIQVNNTWGDGIISASGSTSTTSYEEDYLFEGHIISGYTIQRSYGFTTNEMYTSWLGWEKSIYSTYSTSYSFYSSFQDTTTFTNTDIIDRTYIDISMAQGSASSFSSVGIDDILTTNGEYGLSRSVYGTNASEETRSGEASTSSDLKREFTYFGTTSSTQQEIINYRTTTTIINQYNIYSGSTSLDGTSIVSYTYSDTSSANSTTSTDVDSDGSYFTTSSIRTVYYGESIGTATLWGMPFLPYYQAFAQTVTYAFADPGEAIIVPYKEGVGNVMDLAYSATSFSIGNTSQGIITDISTINIFSYDLENITGVGFDTTEGTFYQTLNVFPPDFTTYNVYKEYYNSVTLNVQGNITASSTDLQGPQTTIYAYTQTTATILDLWKAINETTIKTVTCRALSTDYYNIEQGIPIAGFAFDIVNSPAFGVPVYLNQTLLDINGNTNARVFIEPNQSIPPFSNGGYVVSVGGSFYPDIIQYGGKYPTYNFPIQGTYSGVFQGIYSGTNSISKDASEYTTALISQENGYFSYTTISLETIASGTSTESFTITGTSSFYFNTEVQASTGFSPQVFGDDFGQDYYNPFAAFAWRGSSPPIGIGNNGGSVIGVFPPCVGSIITQNSETSGSYSFLVSEYTTFETGGDGILYEVLTEPIFSVRSTQVGDDIFFTNSVTTFLGPYF